MNYYRRYSGDYLRDTARLTLAEHGAYCLMLDYYYSDEQPLPADHAECYILVRAVRSQERRAVDKVLEQYFVLQADGYHHPRVDREIEESRKARARAKENGAKGGRPRSSRSLRRPSRISPMPTTAACCMAPTRRFSPTACWCLPRGTATSPRTPSTGCRSTTRTRTGRASPSPRGGGRA